MTTKHKLPTHFIEPILISNSEVTMSFVVQAKIDGRYFDYGTIIDPSPSDPITAIKNSPTYKGATAQYADVRIIKRLLVEDVLG